MSTLVVMCLTQELLMLMILLLTLFLFALFFGLFFFILYYSTAKNIIVTFIITFFLATIVTGSLVYYLKTKVISKELKTVYKSSDFRNKDKVRDFVNNDLYWFIEKKSIIQEADFYCYFEESFNAVDYELKIMIRVNTDDCDKWIAGWKPNKEVTGSCFDWVNRIFKYNNWVMHTNPIYYKRILRKKTSPNQNEFGNMAIYKEEGIILINYGFSK